MIRERIPRIARGGVLVLGGGVAGQHVARELRSTGVTVVERSPQLAPGMSRSAELVSGTAAALDAGRRIVRVDSGRSAVEIAYAQLVVALGAPPDLAGTLSLPTDRRGLVRVDESLRVVGATNIWAVGGCAAIPASGLHRNTPDALATYYA